MPDGPANLFVYGSLRNPATFRAITGWTFRSADRGVRSGDEQALRSSPARLEGFELASPDDLYFYAVERAGAHLDGEVLFDVPADALAQLANYEGPHYTRRTATATTASGPVPVEVFTSPAGQLRATLPVHSPGDRGRRLKAEFAFRARIDHHFAGEGEPPCGELRTQSIRVRAAREIRGATIHDLIRAHAAAPGLSEFFIRQALAGAPPSFASLRGNPDVALFADSYAMLLVRQVVFNQFERRLFEEFRYELDRLRESDRCFEHALSGLAAMRMLLGLGGVLTAVAGDALSDLDYRKNEFGEFVEWAIQASDSLYDPSSAAEAVAWIAAHRTGGLLPLSMELDLSNLPHAKLGGAGGSGAFGFDPVYDSFRFFRGFALNVLMWKLGGRVRPIRGMNDPAGQRGLLSLVPGAVGRRSEESADQPEPVTADPWVASQLISHILAFYDIQPHSLAVTIHLPRRLAPVRSAVLPEPIVRCLLALGGDIGPDAEGRIRLRRMTQREIVTLVPNRSLDLLRVFRPPAVPEMMLPARQRFVRARYGFARLDGGVDYGPLILALKGLQLHYGPGEMLTHKQMQADPALERMFNVLLGWAEQPTPIAPADATLFLDAVAAGLNTEYHGRPAHAKGVIDAALAGLQGQIAQFNTRTAQPPNPGS